MTSPRETVSPSGDNPATSVVFGPSVEPGRRSLVTGLAQGVRRLGRWLVGRVRKHSPVDLAVLSGIVAGAFVFRFALLLLIPYPPSADAAGDLVWIRAYEGNPVLSYGLSVAPPPLYFFLAVWPATQLFGVFDGIRVLMALVPALVSVPSFYLIRWAGYPRASAFAIAAIMGTAAALSTMVTWNSAFNAFAMIFAVSFFAFVARELRSPNRGSRLGGALSLSAVAGSHILMFLFVVFALAGILLLTVLHERGTRHRSSRRLLQISLLGALLSLPWIPVYLSNLAATTNVGPPTTASSWMWIVYTLQQTLSFAWGSNSPIPILNPVGYVIVVDVALTVLALPLVWVADRDYPIAVISTSGFAAALAISLSDPGNAARGLYFLPLAFIPALAGLGPYLRRWLSAFVSRSASRRSTSPVVAPVRRGELTAVALIVFVGANLVVSGSVMSESEQFYLVLDGQKVATLNWIRDHTPANARFYDGADLQTWLEGYAGRLGYSPSPLNSRVTQVSYQAGLDANLIDIGNFVLGNGFLYVTDNAPGVYNSPGIFLRTPDYQAPVWLGQSDETWISVRVNGSLLPPLRLANATDISVAGGATSPSSAHLVLTYHFENGRLLLEEGLTLSAATVTIQFRSAGAGAVIEQVRILFRSPPSGYYFDYPAFANRSGTGPVVDSLTIPFEGTATLVANGSDLRAIVQTEPTGWSSMVAVTSGWFNFTLTGWGPLPNGAAFYSYSGNLSNSLGISYWVLSDLTDYPLFERYFAIATQNYGGERPLFQAGHIYIYSSG